MSVIYRIVKFGFEDFIRAINGALDIVLTGHDRWKYGIWWLAWQLFLVDNVDVWIQVLEATDWKSLAAGEELYESWSLFYRHFLNVLDEEIISIRSSIVTMIWNDVLLQLFFILEIFIFAHNSAYHFY